MDFLETMGGHGGKGGHGGHGGHGGGGGHGGCKPSPPFDPVTEIQNASKDGFRTLWVVFVVMVVTSGIFSLRAWSIPVSRRLFHVITTFITITASVSYFAMATGQAVGYSCIKVKDHHSHNMPDLYHCECREIFWARYVDWAITTPLLIVDLCLLAGVDGAHTLMAVFADLIMVLAGLFAAFGREDTAQKWGWYAIGCIAYLFVVWHVAVTGAATVKARGTRATKLFGSLAAFTLILWTIYPIVWGIADGARRTSVNTEIIAYAVLDILAKPVFGVWLLVSHRRIPETNVEVGGYWAHGLSTEGRIRIGDEEGA